MREMELRSRDKKVVKRTRDGLVEKNITQGTEENISGRAPDMRLGREREEREVYQAGHERQIAAQGKRKTGAKVQAQGNREEKGTFGLPKDPEKVKTGNEAGKEYRTGGHTGTDRRGVPPGRNEPHRQQREGMKRSATRRFRDGQQGMGQTERLSHEGQQGAGQHGEIHRDGQQGMGQTEGFSHEGQPNEIYRDGQQGMEHAESVSHNGQPDRGQPEETYSADSGVRGQGVSSPYQNGMEQYHTDQPSRSDQIHTVQQREVFGEMAQQMQERQFREQRAAGNRMENNGKERLVEHGGTFRETVRQHTGRTQGVRDTGNSGGYSKDGTVGAGGTKENGSNIYGEKNVYGMGETDSTDNAGSGGAYSANHRNSVNGHENTEAGRGQTDSRNDGNHAGKAPKGSNAEYSTEQGTDQGVNQGVNQGADQSAGQEAGKEAGKEAAKKQRKTAYQRSYEQAAKRAQKAEKDLQKAQEKLPRRKRLRMETEQAGGAGQAGWTGKVRHRLKFETEVIPEHEKPSLAKRTAEHTGDAISHAARGRLHRKMREVERENVAVEAAHKAEMKAEHAAVRFARHERRRMREKPYRDVRAAQKRLAKRNAEAEYRKLVAETPELQKSAYKKWIQKQRIKRKYAAAYREAAKGAGMVGNLWGAKGQIVRKLLEQAGVKKSLAVLLVVILLILLMAGMIIFAMGAVTGGMQSAVLFTCYTAEDADINAVELWYTGKETELKVDIDDTEMNHRGYDEYFYNIAEIGHNPYELMAYLSAVYDDFTFEQVEPELERLFDLQYTLTRTEDSETRSWTDEDGGEHEYEWESLTTKLTVKPLSGILTENLILGDQMEMYGIYMETCGNRQYFGNPFDFAWIPYVTSPYGYREDPETTSKELHRGIDIGVAEGTPILAILDGFVVSVRESWDLGLCVVVEDENGYQYRYGHCASVKVSQWQEVKKGDIIATVGDTGECEYPHLHLEVSRDGEYLNPYFFVENGGYRFQAQGGAQRPEYSKNPGAPIGDATFAVMLEEAEKYLGCPYVWGGSSPATSFDCSGYVSWVINESGVGNVGRQTAQGLFNLCTPIAREDMQPGDLIFFTGTYSSATPVSHVGIYVGGDYMIHCGNPVSYANISGNYWISHFYSGGRLP